MDASDFSRDVEKSDRWVEAFAKIEKLFTCLTKPIGGEATRIIHVFDREGDIAEVFLEQSQMKNTGVLVRAAHNRCVEADSSYLWEYVREQPVQFTKEVKLPCTKNRIERTATLEVTYCPVSIKAPSRLKNAGSFNVYAVYAKEINAPEGSEPVEWMLLTRIQTLKNGEGSSPLR